MIPACKNCGGPQGQLFYNDSYFCKQNCTDKPASSTNSPVWYTWEGSDCLAGEKRCPGYCSPDLEKVKRIAADRSKSYFHVYKIGRPENKQKIQRPAAFGGEEVYHTRDEVEYLEYIGEFT